MARRSGRRTDYLWASSGDQELAVDLSTNTGTFGTTAFQTTLPQTLTRLRGKVGVTLDAAGVEESCMLLCGVAVVSAEYFVSGSAPEIFVANDSDEVNWVWTGGLYLSAGAEGATNTNGLIRDIEIDSKAMRKMRANSSVVFVHQTPAELKTDGGGTLDITWWLHFLLGS